MDEGLQLIEHDIEGAAFLSQLFHYIRLSSGRFWFRMGLTRVADNAGATLVDRYRLMVVFGSVVAFFDVKVDRRQWLRGLGGGILLVLVFRVRAGGSSVPHDPQPNADLSKLDT